MILYSDTAGIIAMFTFINRALSDILTNLLMLYVALMYHCSLK